MSRSPRTCSHRQRARQGEVDLPWCGERWSGIGAPLAPAFRRRPGWLAGNSGKSKFRSPQGQGKSIEDSGGRHDRMESCVLPQSRAWPNLELSRDRQFPGSPSPGAPGQPPDGRVPAGSGHPFWPSESLTIFGSFWVTTRAPSTTLYILCVSRWGA
jgi:hypothetical protein